MKSKAQQVRLGVFVTLSVTVLVVVIALVTGTRMLKKRDAYRIAYHDVSVSGLEVGGAVKYHGIRVGRIDHIEIDPSDITRIIVTVSVERGTPVAEDMKAVISTIGITGLKLIELSGGTKEGKLLKSGSFIEPGKSLTENITGKAEVISDKIEMLLNNLLDFTSGENRERVLTLIDTTNEAVGKIDLILAENADSFRGTMENLEKSTAGLDSLIASSRTAVTRLDSVLVNFHEVSGELSRADMTEILQTAQSTLEEMMKTFKHIDLTVLKGRKDFIQSLELLRNSLQNISEVSRMLTEDPSTLIRGVEEDEGKRR